MLISEHIKNLQKLLDENGDQELFMWVDSGEDTLFLAKVPILQFAELDGKEYQIPKEFLNKDGNIIAIINLETQSFEEEEDAIQDFDLEDE